MSDPGKIQNPEHAFVEIRKKGTCAKFQQRIFNSVVAGAYQSF